MAGTDKSDEEIVISKSTADRLKLKLGDKVLVAFVGKTMPKRRFRVKGIYETGLDDFDKRYALIDIGVIQDLNNWGKDSVGGFEIFLNQQNLFKSRGKAYFVTLFGGLLPKESLEAMQRDPIEDLSQKVYERINNEKLDVRSIKSLNPGIFDWLDLQTMNELIILSLMLIVAAINMITALLILILERTNMIGIMKALGASNLSVRRIFLYYSVVIIGIGLLIGNVAGIGLCLVEKYYHVIKLQQDSYYLAYAPVEINWAWIGFLNLGTILITLVLLLLPSILVSRISPVKAIRFE